MKSLGICLGASTVSIVEMNLDGKKGGSRPKITDVYLKAHEGNPKRVLAERLKKIDMTAYDAIAVTGRRFRTFVNLSSMSEPEAIEHAFGYVNHKKKRYNAIVSAGGESFMVYVLDKNGKISTVHTGSKCASGTGEFFLQQIRRMGLTLDEAMECAKTGTPHHLSSRCTVFCKSDCTHATNKGVPKGDVTAGLCEMMGQKIVELMKKVPKKDIMIVGGTSQNGPMIDYLKKTFKDLTIPESAPYFEAMGAAVWALGNKTSSFPGMDELFLKERSSFDYLPKLSDFEDMVYFKNVPTAKAKEGDRCIIGLDVGSTTTKAVILRTRDNTVLASIYLRTLGDPVRASRQCYKALLEQTKVPIDIVGLGVCGSGRQIAGLHSLTEGVINEIIAHATAAVYFDEDVDTIFEIGGQDAKYTYITSGVPSDYAMNEACSAGTGSFLEESARETLSIEMEDIADIAMKGGRPPNFSDQCAAFISSDIKRAFHEGIERDDIVAGLVYSICMNYANRVKGNRPMGKKVYMQGGVCLNRAVPIAMAALTGKKIIVPPNPELAGAFGVALAVKDRIDQGLMAEQKFDLRELVDREVEYLKPFICKGGKEKCDRRCKIARIKIAGKIHPFGGACNRYYNLRHSLKFDMEELNLVTLREKLIFETFTDYKPKLPKDAKTIGMNRSFLMASYYPLFYNFFTKLGFAVVLSEKVDTEGIDQIGAPFCYPGEIAHGMFMDLLKKNPDYIFLPHIRGIHVEKGYDVSQACPLTQTEPFYLRQTFRHHIKKRKTKLITETMSFMEGLDQGREVMLDIAKQLGFSKNQAAEAYKIAKGKQKSMYKRFKEIGRKAMKDLEKDPERIAVVFFGRPYNAFVKEANMGIPQKFASRGFMIIPFDFLPYEKEDMYGHMFWAMGQMILKGARFVERHPQLFGTYISNFSCGPDSFIITYFRDMMGVKPSLTLELDSHTADAGLETRIEAALDIFQGYRQLKAANKIAMKKTDFVPARTEMIGGELSIITSSGEKLSLFDPRVRVLFPSMGDLATLGAAEVLSAAGVNALGCEPADEEALKMGKSHTTGKECLPMIITTGTLLKYLKYRDPKSDEVLVYFMPTANGPCRFGQYHVFLNILIKNLELENIAVLSLTSEDSYGGLGNSVLLKSWFMVVIADVMDDMRNMLLANAKDKKKAIKTFDKEYEKVLEAMKGTRRKADRKGGLTQVIKAMKGDWKILEKALKEAAKNLKKIPLTTTLDKAKVVYIIGEIFVRHDGISRRYINERLAEKGFATKVGPTMEWMYYIDYLFQNKLNVLPHSFKEILKNKAKHAIQVKYEKRIKKILAKSGLYEYEECDIGHLVNNVKHLIPPEFLGEAVLTTGVAMTDIVNHACGIVSIGPFGCMPSRVCEAILNETMNDEGKGAISKGNKWVEKVLKEVSDLPFLSIESDGGPFPQIIEANFETFCLQADRLHEAIMRHKGK